MLKTYLITGASSELGIALIKELSENPSNVIWAHYCYNKEALEQIANTSNAKIILFQADFSELDSVHSMLKEFAALDVTPSYLIHCPAPTFLFKRFKKLNWDDIEVELNVQLRSICQISCALVPRMAAARFGRVLFVLSGVTTSNFPPKGLAHYTTAKFAMLGFMKSLAAEFGEKQVCVNAVSPGMMDTKFLDHVPEKLKELNAENHPLKRLVLCQEVLPAMLLLLSDSSSYINGVNIPISGGV